MKHFDAFRIDFDKCRSELGALKDLLKKFEATTLQERKHVLDFFRKNRHIAALAGHFMPSIVNVDRLAYEFDFFGDYAADLAVGDSKRGAYCFIEFENAAPDSIFVKAGKKSSLEWAKRFDKGYSQIIDWFWKLHEMAHTGRLKHASRMRPRSTITACSSLGGVKAYNHLNAQGWIGVGKE